MKKLNSIVKLVPTITVGPVTWNVVTGLVNKQNYDAMKPVVRTIADFTVESWNRDFNSVRKLLSF